MQALKFNAIERMNRWRLFYLDFVDEKMVQDLVIQYPELNSFTPSSDMCCIYLGQSVTDSCTCSGRITVSFDFRFILLDFFWDTILIILYTFLDCSWFFIFSHFYINTTSFVHQFLTRLFSTFSENFHVFFYFHTFKHIVKRQIPNKIQKCSLFLSKIR